MVLRGSDRRWAPRKPFRIMDAQGVYPPATRREGARGRARRRARVCVWRPVLQAFVQATTFHKSIIPLLRGWWISVRYFMSFRKDSTAATNQRR
jgi:hypothetical protein